MAKQQILTKQRRTIAWNWIKDFNYWFEDNQSFSQKLSSRIYAMKSFEVDCSCLSLLYNRIPAQNGSSFIHLNAMFVLLHRMMHILNNLVQSFHGLKREMLHAVASSSCNALGWISCLLPFSSIGMEGNHLTASWMCWSLWVPSQKGLCLVCLQLHSQ